MDGLSNVWEANMLQGQFNLVEAFGFISGFCTIVAIGYRQQLRTRFPVLSLCIACCAIYGFLAGIWTVGFVLLALAGNELRSRLWRARIKSCSLEQPQHVDPCTFVVNVSRVERMFGRSEKP